MYFSEYFYGSKGKRKNPYPDKSTRLALRATINVESATLEFQNGKWDDQVWGYSGDTIFTRKMIRTEDIMDGKLQKKAWITYYEMFISFPLIVEEAQEMLYLGEDKYADLPTDERLMNFEKHDDNWLVSTYFTFGRYLLICSSQPGGQAANLQGIWNDKLEPAWDSKYTTNINLEMNYWPAKKRLYLRKNAAIRCLTGQGFPKLFRP